MPEQITPNAPLDPAGPVYFVGGTGDGQRPLDAITAGYLQGEPRQSGSTWWYSVRVWGVGHTVLVPLENLRPGGDPFARIDR